MYYHVRLDKILHDGRTDLESRIEWDFRSLGKALTMIARVFGSVAKCWRIQDLTEPISDILQLEKGLNVALESTYQYIILTFKDDIPATKRYDHFEFFVVIRDEGEHPPMFAYSAEEEAALSPVVTDDVFVDLYNHPLSFKQVLSSIPVYDNNGRFLSGIAVMLKNGGYCLVVAGDNQRNEEVNLRSCGIEKAKIKKILSSTKDGTDLRGFIVRLTSGDSLYLTIGKFFHRKIVAKEHTTPTESQRNQPSQETRR